MFCGSFYQMLMKTMTVLNVNCLMMNSFKIPSKMLLRCGMSGESNVAIMMLSLTVH